jgi:hypothetical protein
MSTRTAFLLLRPDYPLLTTGYRAAIEFWIPLLSLRILKQAS